MAVNGSRDSGVGAEGGELDGWMSDANVRAVDWV